MKVMVLEEFGAPLVPREREIPVPGEGEVVIKVLACGVCQTDLKIVHGKHPGARNVPLVPGHEVAGEIAEVGGGVDQGLLGKHAVVYNYFICGECEFCRAGRENLCTNIKGTVGFSRDGGFAEYIKVPSRCALLIDGHVAFEKAAIMTDAVVTPYHALIAKAKTKEGDTVAIIGVGGLGVHAVQIAKMLGARVIAVDIKEDALKMARDMGADWTLAVSGEGTRKQILDLTEGRGVDTVIELTGNIDMENLSLNILKPAGRMVIVAYTPIGPFQVKSHLAVSKELEIYGSRWCVRDEFKKCIDLVGNGKIDPIVSEIHPLEEANAILGRLEKGDILGRAVLVP